MGGPAEIPEDASAWIALRRRLAVPLASLLVTHVIGTVGFFLVWRDDGGTIGDAVFMTFTTVTTIGYGEVRPLDGAGRIIAMLVAAGGIGSVFYSFTIMLDWLSSGEIQASRRRRRMKERIATFSDHHVLVGFGRVGREASRELAESGKKLVVIDHTDDNIAVAAELGLPHIKGDASDDETLRAAGIERAQGLIVTTANDATNLYIVMTARLLAPSLFIVSRAVDSSATPKLERAGANRVVSPYAIGGRRMAHLILSPRVVDFFETAMRRGTKALSIGEIQIGAESSAIGTSLDGVRRHGHGATVLTVLRDGQVVTGEASTIRGGDHLLALGTEEQLEALQATIG